MNFLVTDDHVLIREALRGILKELDADAVILEAGNGAETFRLVEQHPDLNLVLLDLNLPDRDGFSVLAELRQRHPAIAVVVLSAINDPTSVRKVLELGALGFIPKSTERNVMVKALQLVFSGGIYIPPEILGREERPPRALAQEQTQAQPARTDRLRAGGLGLTERQIEVLDLMMQGKSNKAICRTLNLAEPTVKNHVTAILRVLKASNRTEAVIAANKLGR